MKRRRGEKRCERSWRLKGIRGRWVLTLSVLLCWFTCLTLRMLAVIFVCVLADAWLLVTGVFLWVHIYVQLCAFVLLSCTQSYSLFRRLRSLMCWWIRCASAVYPCMRWGLPVRSYQSGTCNSVSMRSVWLTTFWLTDWLTNHVWVCVCAHPHTHLLGVALMCAWLLPSMW